MAEYCSGFFIPLSLDPHREEVAFGAYLRKNFIVNPHLSLGKRYHCNISHIIWLVVWNILYFPIYWVSNHPNWRSYFSEGWPNHQPVIVGRGPCTRPSSGVAGAPTPCAARGPPPKAVSTWEWPADGPLGAPGWWVRGSVSLTFVEWGWMGKIYLSQAVDCQVRPATACWSLRTAGLLWASGR